MISDSVNFSDKSLALGLLIVAIAGIVLGTSTNTMLSNNINNNEVYAQQQTTSTSVQHNAKGHQSHQVINLQNTTEGIIYSGTVTFNSSKPIDIIAYDDITGQTNTNATVQVWEVDGKKYAPKTLMKNATEGTVNFEGAGILTHSTTSEPYQVTFSINAAPITKSQ
jgi:hypothetical protein